MNLFPIFVNLNTVTIEFALSNHLFSVKLDKGSDMMTKQIPVIYKYKEDIHLETATTYAVIIVDRRRKEQRNVGGRPSSKQLKHHGLA